jgi:hypothetical protein
MGIKILKTKDGKEFPLPANAAGLSKEDVITSIENIANFAGMSPAMDVEVFIEEDGIQKYKGMISGFNRTVFE